MLLTDITDIESVRVLPDLPEEFVEIDIATASRQWDYRLRKTKMAPSLSSLITSIYNYSDGSYPYNT